MRLKIFKKEKSKLKEKKLAFVGEISVAGVVFSLIFIGKVYFALLYIFALELSYGLLSFSLSTLFSFFSVEYNVSYVYHAIYAYFDRDNVALKGFAK